MSLAGALLVLSSLPSISCLSLDVVISVATPFNFTQIAHNLLDSQAIKWLERQQLPGTSWAPVVLDYSYSASLSLLLLETASDSLVIGMYEGCPEQEINGRLGIRELSESLKGVLMDLQFGNVFLLSTAETAFEVLSKSIEKSLPQVFSKGVILDPASDYQSALNIVGKVVKPAGTNLGLLLLDEITGGNVIMALQEYELLGEGFAYVSLQESVWRVMSSGAADGLIYIGDGELAVTRNREEFERGLLKSQLEALEKVGIAEADSPASLRSSLMSTYHGKARNVTSSLVNIQHSSPRQVSFSSLLFPGNSPSFPKSTQATLFVSVNNDGHDPNGDYYPEVIVVNRGFMVAYSEVNNRTDILPNFQIHVNSVGFGTIAFDPDWAITQIEKDTKAVGLAHHPVALSPNIIGITAAFHRLGMEIPVSTGSGSTHLSSPRRYPLFLRTMTNSMYTALAMIRFFALFGWKKAAIISSWGDEDADFCECFKNASKSHNINITNTLQFVPYTFDSADDSLNLTLAEILASNTRIVIISHPNNKGIVERMYDLGARSGDYLLILAYGLSYYYFAGSTEGDYKRRIVGKGAVSFLPSFFTGETGRKTMQSLMAVDGENYYTFGCVYYDCAMLVSHALDYMIAKGLHYERGSELVNAMRSTRFVGCIGRVQIEQGTNDNVPGDSTILNLHYNPGNDTMKLVTVATYSPNKAQMFNLTGNMQWPNDEAAFPDSWEEDEDCPYLRKDIVDFPKGQMVGLTACFLFSGVTGVVTVAIWNKWWRVEMPQLVTQQLISVEDVLVLVSIPVDFLQFAAVAPALGITDLLEGLFNSTSLNLESMVSFTHGVYWAIEIAVFVMVFLYVGIFWMKLWAVDERLRKWDCCSFVAYWADLLLPTFGNVMFLPIISTLLSTFNCYRAVGEEFTDSFLNRDCAEKCWSGKHLYFVSFAAICLVAYTPIAVFTRPLWQDLQSNLHLKALPLYLMLKSVLQMFLISASATLKFAYHTAHAAVYFCLLSLYVCFLGKYEAFNYARASLWHFLVVLALWLYGLVGLLHWCMQEISSSQLLSVLGAVYGALGIIGLLLQTFKKKYRSLLKREKGPDKSDIIKFGFTFGNLASFHLSNFQTKQIEFKNKDPATAITFQK